MGDYGCFDKPVVIIDNGSQTIKAGFSTDNHPVSIFRNVVGRPSSLHGQLGKHSYQVYVGDDAIEKETDYDLFRPIEDNKIVNWNNMERVWHHIFYRELKVAPEDRNVLLGCAATTTMTEKIKCCEVFFENLNIPGMCIQHNSVLAQYGSGNTTGVTVDLGYDSTGITPVYEGSNISYAHIETGTSGLTLAKYLNERLQERGYYLGFKAHNCVEDIKRDLCYVLPKRPDETGLSLKTKTYKLPSGQVIDVTREAAEASELLFEGPPLRKTRFSTVEQGRWSRVSLNSFSMVEEPMSLQSGIISSILRTDEDLQDQFFESIVVCGGLAPLPGLNQRILLELTSNAERKVNINLSSESCTVSWMGGAILAGNPHVSCIWITRKLYEEHGPRIVRNKLFC